MPSDRQLREFRSACSYWALEHALTKLNIALLRLGDQMVAAWERAFSSIPRGSETFGGIEEQLTTESD